MGIVRTVVDLSHAITPDMPVYPGTEPPTLRDATTVERDGFAEKLICMYSHTGTHVDAPAHMLTKAPTLDQFDAGHFVGPACVIDVSGRATIERSQIAVHDPVIEGCDFVLLHTGWSRFWGQERYFQGFPVLSADASRWLARSGLRGIGVDAISVDPVGTTTYENHLELFRSGLISIENLTGLAPLIGRRFLFSCLPLKFDQADGAPVRAVAILGVAAHEPR
jgi:arylformamidase